MSLESSIIGAVVQLHTPAAARQMAVVARIFRNEGMVMTKRVSVTGRGQRLYFSVLVEFDSGQMYPTYSGTGAGCSI